MSYFFILAIFLGIFATTQSSARSFNEVTKGSTVVFREVALVSKGPAFKFKKIGAIECEVYLLKSPDDRNLQINSTRVWNVIDNDVMIGFTYDTVAPRDPHFGIIGGMAKESPWALNPPSNSFCVEFDRLFNYVRDTNRFLQRSNEANEIDAMNSAVRLLHLQAEISGESVELVLGCRQNLGERDFETYGYSEGSRFPFRTTITLPYWPEPSIEQVDPVFQVSIPAPLD